jgi:hypothetical protein
MRWFTAAMLVVCSTAHAQGNRPTAHVSAGGQVVFGADTVEISLNAKTQKGVTTGHAGFKFADYSYAVAIDCLHVTHPDRVDGAAWLSGIVSEATGPIIVGSAVSFEIIDYGEGHGAKDEISLPVPGVSLPCETEPVFALFAWTHGNVQVKGEGSKGGSVGNIAPATPTEKTTWGQVKHAYR